MDFRLLFGGLLIGILIAVPVGPIGILCIRRTLTVGRAAGLASGLGAATADAIYGIIAGFGLTFISSLLISQKAWVSFIGGASLCYLGIRTFMAKPAEQKALADRKQKGLLRAYATTFFLTLTNPMTILSFAAIFAGLGLGGVKISKTSAAILVLGVFIGSCLWWLLLSAFISLFQSRFSLKRLRWLNMVSGVIITAFGLIALLNLMG